MRLFGECEPSRDVARIVSQKYADGVLLLTDLTFEIGDFRCSRVNQLLRFPDIRQRIDSVLFESLRQLQRLTALCEGAVRNFQFEIQLAELEVTGGEVRDQSRHYLVLSPLIREQGRT